MKPKVFVIFWLSMRGTKYRAGLRWLGRDWLLIGGYVPAIITPKGPGHEKPGDDQLGSAVVLLAGSDPGVSGAPPPEHQSSHDRHDEKAAARKPPLSDREVEERLDDASGQLDWFTKRLAPR